MMKVGDQLYIILHVENDQIEVTMTLTSVCLISRLPFGRSASSKERFEVL